MAFEAVFSSLSGGDALTERVLGLLAEACTTAATHAVALDIMTFSFTDSRIADALASAATRPGLEIRLITDWTQRASDGHQQVGRLTALGLANLRVRYKKDQPYVWDVAAARMQWSYRASLGMLHHKTLSVAVDGEPSRMLCGSYNWSAKSAGAYENLLIVTDSTAACRELMARMRLEFEALWSDDTASLSPDQAQAHYAAIAESYRGRDLTQRGSVRDTSVIEAAMPRVLPSRANTRLRVTTDGVDLEPSSSRALIAFSSRRPHDDRSHPGYAESNRSRFIVLRTPGGRTTRVPLTITALTLDIIYRSRPGDTLLIAMYGLSTRIPEYSALLDSARRGVRLRILLDRKVGRRPAESLARVRLREDLPIYVKSGTKMMHEKYIVNPDTATVVTGTANMSTDASNRHSEHRITVSGDPALAGQFAADFETIWTRVGNATKKGWRTGVRLP